MVQSVELKGWSTKSEARLDVYSELKMNRGDIAFSRLTNGKDGPKGEETRTWTRIFVLGWCRVLDLPTFPRCIRTPDPKG